MLRPIHLSVCALLTCFAIGCSETAGFACESGRQVACACGGGVEGFQLCRDDGSGFDPCVCADAGKDSGLHCDDGTMPDLNSVLCDDCLDFAGNGPCQEPFDACTALPECQRYQDCIAPCDTNDLDCRQTCIVTFNSGFMAFTEFLGCAVCVVCVNNCDGPTNCGRGAAARLGEL